MIHGYNDESYEKVEMRAKEDIDNLEADVNVLKSEVSSLASGSPLVASSIAGMTDTSRVYVNTTNGHWYWYDGTNWRDGGVYQSTGIAENSINPFNLDDITKNHSFKNVTQNDINWVCMNIYSGNIFYADDAITTGEFIYFKVGDVIELLDSTNYRIRVTHFDNNFNYVSQRGYFQSSITINRDGYALISIAKVASGEGRPLKENISNIISFAGLKSKNLDEINYKDLSFVNKRNLPYTDWEIGSIYDTTGVVYPHTKRVRSKTFYKVNVGDIISVNCDKGLRISVIQFNDNYEYIKMLDDEQKCCDNNKIVIDRNCYVKFVLRIDNDNPSTIVEDDLPFYDNIVTIYDNILKSTKIDITEDEETTDVILPNNNILTNSAHRGYYGSLLPENTIVAYQYAKNKKFDYIEVDVQRTSDGVYVICHDGTINRIARNTDGTEISQQIYVNQSTFDDLNQYDYGIYRGSQFAGTHILTFEEVCRFAKYNNIRINIDYKVAINNDYLDEVYAIVQKYGLQYQVRFTIPNSSSIRHLLTKNPKVEVALGSWTATTAVVDVVKQLKNDYPNSHILLDCNSGAAALSEEVGNYIRANDVELSCYCESNEQIIRAVNFGATYLTINNNLPYTLLKNTYDNS